MNLAVNVCRLGCVRVNNIYKFGGCLSRDASTMEKYKIEWKRPPKVPIMEPIQSGDLGLDITVKPSEIQLYYDRSKELDDASSIVKKMFSVEFQHGSAARNLKREKTMALVKRHASDRGSVESSIAAMTSEIHHMQEYFKDQPRNRKAKVFLKELIEKRHKQLKLLRKWDYRRFEWILERLNLVYKPMPVKLGMVTRKDSIRKLTQDYCDKIVQDKIDAYKAEMRVQQKIFFREKAEKLAFIRNEELECGVTPTVTEQDIEAARREAEKL
ncbi:28S ribosomal protein S15, mitochondrial [Halictus rubicundus]|uniref:28S ribosomal protein S15, mitochondrial n=1 Tax=Halictus rubicundus TaxID=77578 RepID=UPI0040350146